MADRGAGRGGGLCLSFGHNQSTMKTSKGFEPIVYVNELIKD